MNQCFPYFASLPTWVLTCFIVLSYSDCLKMKSQTRFDLHFPGDWDVDHFFKCFSAICIFSCDNIFLGLLPIFNWVIYFLDHDFLKFFTYFQIQPFFEFAVDKNHFPFWALWLCPNDAVLCYTEPFSLMRSHLLIIDLSAYANDG